MSNRKKVGIGKIGQKLIFNREQELAKRSNTNGNVGAYLFYKLLIENNPDIDFYMIGDSDLETFETPPYDNLFDVTKWKLSNHKRMSDVYDLDYCIMIIGLLKETNDDIALEILNHIGTKWLLIADDPRCLNTKAKDIINMPTKIVSQHPTEMKFAGKTYKVNRLPIETASAYQQEVINPFDKLGKAEDDFVVISNGTADFDRTGIVSRMIECIDNTKVYGRVPSSVMRENSKFVGEVDFESINNIMKTMKTTLLVPISPGWVTSKYVEALLNGVLPIMHVSYGYNYLNGKNDFDVVTSPYSLKQLLDYYDENQVEWYNKVIALQDKFVKPFIDGRLLSKLIIETCERM